MNNQFNAGPFNVNRNNSDNYNWNNGFRLSYRRYNKNNIASAILAECGNHHRKGSLVG